MSTIPAIRAVETRFRVWRGSSPTDLSGFLARARAQLGDVSTIGTGSSGGDGVSMTGDFTLRNDRPGNDGLQPSDATSEWNQPNPLLSPNRRVTLEVRATPEGEPTAPWRMVFDGLIDSVRVQQNASLIDLKARDWAKVLQSTMLPGDTTYGAEGGQRLDLVLQQLVTDNIPNAPTITVVGTPNFFVDPYKPAFGSVWDACQQLVTQAGWYFGMYRNAAGEFVLTLLDPPRDKTEPDWVFTGEDVLTADIDRSDRDVRNAFLIRYVDEVTREPTQYPLAGPYVNHASVAAIGGIQKLMIIELDSTSQINTASEAAALLASADHDLSYMFEGTQVELPIMPELNLFDTVLLTLPQVGNQQLFAVNSLAHTIDISDRQARFRTTIAGMSRVVGKYRDWLDLEVRPGSPNDARGPHQTKLLPPRVSLLPGQPGFIVAVEAGPASRGIGAVGVEVHWSTTNGFNPGPSTVRAAGPEERFSFAPNSNATHYVRVRAYDEHERYGPFSPQLSIVPARVDGRWLVLDQNVQINGDLAIVGGSNDGTLLFYQGAIHPDNLRLAIGEVGGLFGAPSGAVGIAGPLGTGAWFEGVPRMVAVYFGGVHNGDIFPSGPVNIGDRNSIRATAAVVTAPYTVPAGKRWVVQSVIGEGQIVGFGDDVAAMAGQHSLVTDGAFGTPFLGNVVPAGTYTDDLVVQNEVYFVAFSASSGPIRGNLAMTVTVLEVDA